MPPDLIHLDAVSHSYRVSPFRYKMVIDTCSLTIKPGEVIGLIGDSGSGKSTLGRIIAGLERPVKGRVLYKSADIWQMDSSNHSLFRRDVQMLFQDPGGSFNPIHSIKRSFDAVFSLLTISNYDLILSNALKQVGLHEEILTRYPHQISGGQAQRLALARILLLNPSLLILDEPTSGLDISVQAHILHLLKELIRSNAISCIFISHDHEVVSFMTDRILSINNGELNW